MLNKEFRKPIFSLPEISGTNGMFLPAVLLLSINDKNDINNVYAYGNDTFPAVQRAFFSGKHENEQQQACQNHHADVNVVLHFKR